MALLDVNSADIVTLLQRTNQALGGVDPPRVPIQWQSVSRAKQNIAPLLMTINPQQIQFQQAKRIQKQDVQGGSVFFHFSNGNGQNNDILTLQLSGTTGNIDPRSVRNRMTSPILQLGEQQFELTNDRTKAADNLRAWISFYSLTQEPILDMELGIPNLVTMTYASPLFQKPILFLGFFQSVLQFSESAQEPFQRQWSVPFTVVSTQPKMDKLSSYLGQILTSVL